MKKKLSFLWTVKLYNMPELKMQDAQMLLKKIYANPKNYDLKSIDGVVSGGDDQVSFRLYKTKEKVVLKLL